MIYKKQSDKEISVSETQPDKVITYTYDFILNKIQELETELEKFKNLKKEADKFNLKR